MAEAETIENGEGETTADETKNSNTVEETTTSGEAGEPTVRKDIVPPQYRKLYQELGGNCGDFIAAELSATMEKGGVEALNSIKGENNINAGAWSGLNNGQQRMNLSNRLRAAFLRGETITIQGKQYNIETQREEFGKLDPLNGEQVDKFLEFITMQKTDRNRKAIVRVFHDLPEKGRLRAEREEKAAQAKVDKAAAKEAAQKAKDEAKLKAEAEKPAAEAGAEASSAAPKRGRKKSDKVEEPA